MANDNASVFTQPPRITDRLFGWYLRWRNERMLRKALPKAIVKKEEKEQNKGFWNSIVSIVKKFFNWIKRKILNGVLSFFGNIFSFFKSDKLKRGRDIPFVADAKSEKMREAFGFSPSKNVGIFQGVYNENTEEITRCEYIEADAMDYEAKEMLRGNPLVVLK